MTALLSRLQAAERGTVELSAEALNFLHGFTGREAPDERFEVSLFNSGTCVVNVEGRPGWEVAHRVGSIAESIDAAWEFAEAEGYRVYVVANGTLYDAAISRDAMAPFNWRQAFRPALAITAALVAAKENAHG